jgi:hypothetical protein
MLMLSKEHDGSPWKCDGGGLVGNVWLSGGPEGSLGDVVVQNKI